MSRAALITGWVLALALAWVAWEGAKSAQEARQNARAIATQLEELETALTASRRLSTVRGQTITKITKERDTARQELLHALQSNAEWAADRIPDGVYSNLSGPKADAGRSLP